VKRKHHELKAWQEAMKLVKDIYSITASFPKVEIYGLTGQMRRAAVSVPSNIAEGAARIGPKELGCFDLEEKIFEKVNKVFGLIGGLMKSVNKEKY
jgi:hypothetical protein